MRNFNYSFSIILGLQRKDSTKRETDRYRNMHYDSKENMSLEKRTRH